VTTGAGYEPGQIVEAYGIAVDEHGVVYLADTAAHRIQTYDHAAGTWAVLAEGHGTAPDQFSRPRGVAIFPPAVSR
jgi:streptogramin lyase